MPNRNLNLLSLDGGGVRGLSTLLILRQLMEAIDREHPPKPCEYFQFIGGTGSGGVIAIMLGRLEMDIEQCIRAYTRLLRRVFASKRTFPVGSNLRMRPKYDIKRLGSAMRAILRELNYDDDMLLRDEDGTCRTFIPVTDSTSRKLVPLTSYPSPYCPTELYKTTRVWEAAQASFASGSLFEPVRIGPSGREFQDSTPEVNNPMREVWIEARSLWRSGSLESQLRCMVSIGTGVPSIKRLGRNMFGMSRSKHEVVDAETETNRFLKEHTDLDDDHRLFRFDVPNGLADIKPDGVDDIETVVEATEDYLAKELMYKQADITALTGIMIDD
ncbi:hypothetical protein N8T08_003223 [Aspergillus melleus]|uniref:Uncharacterized protein n=1 Tax=Aspergillus melleus TaxID=138277 RepID=A0ACC3B757_9EURO|nr:hypothetical protein N8T08_003223 [Aspergillus melleus]